MRIIIYAVMVLLAGLLVSCGGDDNGVDPDTTAPTVASIVPADGEENVPLNTVITVVFSEKIDSASVNETTFVVSGNIPGSIGLTDKTATFTPDQDLAVNTTYAVSVTDDIKDLAGNSMDSNYTWQFTTAEVVLTNGPDYFPMAEGDTWYYTDGDQETIVRTVSGDTVIAGNSCKRILHNDQTAEAWSIITTGDSAGFYVHLLTDIYNYRFEPPLVIPFDLVFDAPYNYQSTAYWVEDQTPYYAEISGTLKFKGYEAYTTPTGLNFDDAIKFFYIPDGYYEHYARNVGLLDNGDFVLDSAYVGGVWYRP